MWGGKCWGGWRVQVQQQVETSRAAAAYYQRALQELTLFKSKTSAALLQVPPSPLLSSPS